MRIVISEFIDDAAVTSLAQEFEVRYDAALVERPAELGVELGRADALIVRNRTHVDAALLAGAPRLKVVGGAALDVFEREPLPAASVLAGCPGLLLTPHIAGVTRESNARVSALVAREVAAALLRRGGDDAHA